MPLGAGSRLGPYEILSPIGFGGMGEVYKARDTRLGREVAVKVLPPHAADSADALARFEREARAVAALSHPHILAIHDFGREGDVTYSVTELLEGETLRDRLAASAIPPRKAVEYAEQMLRGLAAAHDRGIVHRDLKPENVFLTRDGLVKILDFGLARPAGEGGRSGSGPQSLTASGTVVGTPGYMSPEQIRGKAVDQRSDLFALAAILYEMLTGQRAFHRDSPVETMMSVLQEDPSLASGVGVPPALSGIVTHGLEKAPEDRFQSARDFAFALLAADREASGAQSPAAGTLRPAEPSDVSIAVLPFRNLSTGPDAEYFSDGMTEEIINALAAIASLRVAARTSSFAFKGKDSDVRHIGRELGVRTVLEGSVRQAGQKLRITAQLVDVSSGYHVWSDRFDRDMRDVFAVQDEISRAIASALKVKLLPAQQESLVKSGTRDVEAYNRFLKGRYFFNQRASKKAIAEFDAAIARDPSFAAAYTGLADSYCTYGFYGGFPTLEAFARARAATTKARELSPDAPDVHLALGLVDHYYGWDLEREERHFRRVIELAPQDASGYSWLACLLSASDRRGESLALGRRAVELEPLSASTHVNASMAHYFGREPAPAIDGFRKAVHVDPNSVYALFALGIACLSGKQYDEGVASLERLSALTDREMPWPLALLGTTFAAAGKTADARRLLAELDTLSGRCYVPPLHVAFVHAQLGDVDRTVELLTQALEERNALYWAWVPTSPPFDAVRSDPRVQALIRAIRPT
ncbi:MAG TPA: protein kinase [Thermoanaerobaculia bacterium]|nr:protein kinase [Thermoanaerobaculia bacterium]